MIDDKNRTNHRAEARGIYRAIFGIKNHRTKVRGIKPTIFNKKEFESIRKDLIDFEEQRESLITQARQIIQLSKKIIYALHRDDLENAEREAGEIKKLVGKLPEGCYETGMRSAAVQEYVEALAYYCFIREGRIPARKELGVGTNDYLMGLCDLTGELVRKAVRDIIKGDYKAAIKIKEIVDEIHGEFLHFELRNGELRKKSDSIKYNLKKLEEIVYDIKLKARK